MKKNYISPILSIEIFNTKDVITVSLHGTSATADKFPVIDADKLEYK